MDGGISSENGSLGSSNPLQDDIENGNVHGNSVEESFNAISTATESLQSDISVCSESNLLVPGKLFSDICKPKSCYLSIIQGVYNSVKSSVTDSSDPSETHVLMLTREQLEAGVKQGKMGANTARQYLVDLLELTQPVCVPSYQEDTRPKILPVDSQLHEISANIKSLSSQHSCQFDTLKAELDKLQSTVSNYESMLSQTTTPNTDQLFEIPTDVSPPDINIPYLEHSIDDFLSEVECNQLMSNLADSPYVKERGRLTLKFGEQYSYNGSRGESVAEIPPYLKAIMDKLNDNYVSQDSPALNSCVVNKYVGPTSFIPSHSDDERSIHPDSNIFTVSVGKEATVHFTSTMNNATHDHVAKNGSMYSMSRQSQGCFKHQVKKDSSWTGNDFRLSLTFRSVHWRNNNSTILMGDSNTGGLKFASFGKSSPSHDLNGTFGNALPGKRVPAFVVDEINAEQCVGYNNIVIHCGLNDVRKTDVVSHDDVRAIYIKLKSKINQLSHVNKRARIYVNLLLPTKLYDCNKKIKYFHKLIIDDLCKSFTRVKYIDSYRKFTDSNGFLSSSLSREFSGDNQPDYLHLNIAGLRVLSVCIKRALFASKRLEGSIPRSGRVGGGAQNMDAGESNRRQQGSSSDFRADDSDNPRRGGRRGGYTNHRRHPRR